MFASAIAKIMASEKSSTALSCVEQPITMKMQNSELNVIFAHCSVPNYVHESFEAIVGPGNHRRVREQHDDNREYVREPRDYAGECA